MIIKINTFGKSITKPWIKFVPETYARVHADFFSQFSKWGL